MIQNTSIKSCYCLKQWDLPSQKNESELERKARYRIRVISKTASFLGAIVLSCLLFTLGFMVSSFDEAPSLLTKPHGIPMSDVQDEEEQNEPIEATLTPKPDTPQMSLTPEVIHIDIPPINIDYTINTNITIGMQVPAPPSFAQQAISTEAYSVGQLDEQPAIMYSPRPQYPSAAIRAHKEGRVIVRAIINSDGRVTTAQILSGPSSKLFEKESLLAIKRWRFRPGKLNGRKVSTIVEIPLIFSLDK